MKEINRERFEAWLFSQPKEREFFYTEPSNCAFCHFVHETTNWLASCSNDWAVGKTRDNVYEWERHPFPEWLYDKNNPMRGVLGVHSKGIITIADMQARYLELFPDALKLSEVKTETVNHEQNS